MAESAGIYPDRSLHSRLVNSIGRRIITGAIPVGSALPTEAELIEQFSVSRTVVREATKILAGKGLIETRTRLGSRVKPVETWNLLDPDVVSWRYVGSLEVADFEELIQLRQVIEPGIAGLAAVQASQGDRELMRTCYERMEASEHDPEALALADREFHEAIVDSVGNELLRYIYNVIGSGLSEIRAMTVYRRKHEVRDTKLHKVVLDAILAHDQQAAITAMNDIVSASRKAVLTYLTNALEQDQRRED